MNEWDMFQHCNVLLEYQVFEWSACEFSEIFFLGFITDGFGNWMMKHHSWMEGMSGICCSLVLSADVPRSWVIWPWIGRYIVRGYIFETSGKWLIKHYWYLNGMCIGKEQLFCSFCQVPCPWIVRNMVGLLLTSYMLW